MKDKEKSKKNLKLQVPVQLRFPQDLLDILDKEAELYVIPRSTLIRKIVIDHLREKKKLF